MKALLHSYVYWPNKDMQLEELGQNCSKYQQVLKFSRKTTLYSWSTPESPLSQLHVDFVGPINGQYYLILVDAYIK